MRSKGGPWKKEGGDGNTGMGIKKREQRGQQIAEEGRGERREEERCLPKGRVPNRDCSDDVDW